MGGEPRQTQGGWSSSMFEMTSLKPTYHYKSRFDGRFGDLAVRPTCLRPLFRNDAYTPMRMRDKSYADNSSLITASPVLQSPPAWASIVPPDCALIEFLSCAIRISSKLDLDLLVHLAVLL